MQLVQDTFGGASREPSSRFGFDAHAGNRMKLGRAADTVGDFLGKIGVVRKLEVAFDDDRALVSRLHCPAERFFVENGLEIP